MDYRFSVRDESYGEYIIENAPATEYGLMAVLEAFTPLHQAERNRFMHELDDMRCADYITNGHCEDGRYTIWARKIAPPEPLLTLKEIMGTR